MPEYSLDQASDLAMLAELGLKDLPEDGLRRRNCLYLALLSIELSLKAALEKAGMSIVEIRGMNHRLDKLLQTFADRCIYKYSVSSSAPPEQGRGAAIKDLTVKCGHFYLRVGYMLHSDIWKTLAAYPSEIRYSATTDPKHFDPKFVAPIAALIGKWLRERFATLQLT